MIDFILGFIVGAAVTVLVPGFRPWATEKVTQAIEWLRFRKP